MIDRSSRTVVLLGAGASADAGLPLTSALAASVVQAANGSIDPWGLPASARALNVVYGAMVMHQSAHGGYPLGAVNIETLISAVRLLSDRAGHEVAPFVSSWIEGLADLASSDGHEAGDRILSEVSRGVLNSGGSGRAIEQAVTEIALSVQRPDLFEPMRAAEAFILERLVQLLGEPDDVELPPPAR